MTEQERETRALLGFMEEQDAMNFLKGMGISKGKTDQQAREVWVQAHAEVEKLPIPDLSPEILDIDKKFDRELDAVSKNPLFTEAVQGNKWSFKLLEIDKLVCFQKFVYTDHAQRLAQQNDFSDMAKLIGFCFTEKSSKRPFVAMTSPQDHSILSPSHDLRIIGPAQPVQDPLTNRTVYGFAIGFGIPFIQVGNLQGRYFLKNGYHRVYAMRLGGVKHVPCILIQCTTFGDLNIARAGFFDEPLLLSNKPPVFANFFNEKVAPTVFLKPITKILRIKADEQVLPVVLPQSFVPETPAETLEPEEKPGPTPQEDFNILKEDWNTYKLSDGTTLKLRQVLIKVTKPASTIPGIKNLQVQPSTLLMATLSPPRLKGHPDSTSYAPEQLAEYVVEQNVKARPIRAVVNEYLTTSGLRILLQLDKITVGRTSKFDANGDPQYLVNAQIGIQIIPPENTTSH